MHGHAPKTILPARKTIIQEGLARVLLVPYPARKCVPTAITVVWIFLRFLGVIC